MQSLWLDQLILRFNLKCMQSSYCVSQLSTQTRTLTRRWSCVKDNPFLAERCNLIEMSGHCHDMLSVVCLSSVVTRVYCDKTAEVRIMQFSPKNVAQCHNSLPAKFDNEIRRGSPRSGGSNWLGVIFDFTMHAISRKLCGMELRWQLITNMKSYMGFRLQRSLTLNNLERKFTALSIVLCVLLSNGWG